MEEKAKKFQQLYDLDAYQHEADQLVTACDSLDGTHPGGANYSIACETTIFYPEGGGQAGDIGFIGSARVFDTQWKDISPQQDKSQMQIVHYTDIPLQVGQIYKAKIDWTRRFDFMQQHSGEHLLSGQAKSLFGVNNVGFHLGDRETTVDFDQELHQEQIERLIQETNLQVFANKKIKVSILPATEAATLDYRSKIDLKGLVRLISIEDGDLCACAAPHVHFTGEIGPIIVQAVDTIRQGSRLTILCGQRALQAIFQMQKIGKKLSQYFSVPITDLISSIEKQDSKIANQENEKKACADYAWNNQHIPTSPCIILVCNPIFDEAFLKQKAKSFQAEGTEKYLLLFSSESGFRFYLSESRYEWILTLREEFSAKGGGPAQLMTGFIPTSIPVDIVEQIRSRLECNFIVM